MFVQWWPIVYDAGPALYKHWVDVSCFLGCTPRDDDVSHVTSGVSHSPGRFTLLLWLTDYSKTYANFLYIALPNAFLCSRDQLVVQEAVLRPSLDKHLFPAYFIYTMACLKQNCTDGICICMLRGSTHYCAIAWIFWGLAYVH